MNGKGDIRVLLADSVLEDKSLERVLAYLRESIGKQILITDYKGMICTGEGKEEESHPDNRYSSVPYDEVLDRVFCDQSNNRCYYRVGPGDKDGFIVIEGIEAQQYTSYLETLDNASLAVRTYLAQISAIEELENLYTDNLITDLLLRNVNIKDLIKNNYALRNLDLNNLYYVCIFEPLRPLSSKEMNAVLSYTKDWINSAELGIIGTVWHNKYMVKICPTHYDARSLEVDHGWDRHLGNISRYFDEIRSKFNIPAVFGIGNKYPIAELHRSYQEALVTVQLSKLTGKSECIRQFSDLGIFSLIFKQENTELKNFCEKYLGPILELDGEYKRDLLDSLGCFFDANLDVKEAANRLHLHINTLRYRLKKIEELSNMNLNQMEDRANLYVALKVYELLQALELSPET